MVLLWHCLLISGQFRQFQRPSTNNHDLLKQIVKSTPDDVARLADRLGDRRTSILDRARFRPKSLRKPFERPSSPRVSPSRSRSCDCEDVRTENDLLKQLVDKLTKQVEASEQRVQQQSSPLSLISEALKTRLGLAPVSKNGLNPFLPGSNERGIRRVVSQAEPVTSTILITTSYQSLVTSSVTRDISILFQGRYSTTHVLDSVIQTSTITDTITSLVEITPSVTLPVVQANTLALLLNKLQEQNIPEADRSFSQIRTTTSEKPERLDSFETLKGYLNRIKTGKPPFKRPSLILNKVTTEGDQNDEKEKEVEVQTQNNYRANLFGRRNLLKEKISSSIYRTHQPSIEPSIEPSPTEVSPAPTVTESPSLVVNVASSVRVEEGEEEEPEVRTSVVTLYLSGSVPGVFSTSLQTVILPSEGESQRYRREAVEILPTRSLEAPEMTDSYWDLIESSLNSLGGDSDSERVTVTITRTLYQASLC